MCIILFQLERNISAVFNTELLKGFFIIFLNCENIIGLIEFCLFPGLYLKMTNLNLPILCLNVAAQIVAFACGKEDENRNKNFEGGRPSSIIIGEQLTPASLGALLAHFENKIMFQGFLWNVNSFDQEGVQLGKVLAKRVLAHETDGALRVFSDLLNI